MKKSGVLFGILIVFACVLFVRADVVSVNSGGSDEIVINPDEAIEGFFSGVNTPPEISEVILNSTYGTNFTTENLTCYVLLTDPEGDNLNTSVRWYKNNSLNLTIDYNFSYSNGTFFNGTLLSGNTSKGESWLCSVRTYDGLVYSDWTNSSNLTIENSLPVVTLIAPENNNKTSNRNPTFNWSGYDADSDEMTYDLRLLVDGSCVCSDARNPEISGVSYTNYTIVDYLKCLSDNGCYYNWSARAHDGDEYGNWTDEWKLNISAVIDITLINDTIEFGSLGMDESKNTTTNEPYPFLLQNDGNCFNNVTINASDLWESVSTSEYYRFKIDNYTSEEESFNWSNSETAWTNVPVGDSLLNAITKLNWSNATDTAEIDLLVTVPPEEGAGDRESLVQFVASLGE